MIHASLFSGIGGFDLAAEWAGWDNAFNCEIDTFCRKVLKYHFPNAAQYEDIKTTDFTVWRGKIDVLTGGFPCQPFSIAGKRKGTADNRYLWPEMLRAIREIRPKWVVGENVLGIISWNGGMVFEQVHADLEAERYEVQAYVLPACGVDAPHQRYRTWFVAKNTKCNGCSVGEINEERTAVRKFGDARSGSADRIHIQERIIANHTDAGYESKQGGKDDICPDRYATDSTSKGFKRTLSSDSIMYSKLFSNFPTQSPVYSRDDGFPIPMDGITFPRWRAESIKAYGNAIVPQVAYRIFNTINKMEEV